MVAPTWASIRKEGYGHMGTDRHGKRAESMEGAEELNFLLLLHSRTMQFLSAPSVVPD